MGAAKNRKAEIEALKAAGPKFGNKYVSIGVFFKANEDHGFSILLDNQHLAKIDEFTRSIITGAAGYDKNMLPEFESKQAMADWLIEQSMELCDAINFNLYGSSVQPHYGTKVQKDIGPVLGDIFILMANVTWLEGNGFLKANDNNGMMFVSK